MSTRSALGQEVVSAWRAELYLLQRGPTSKRPRGLVDPTHRRLIELRHVEAAERATRVASARQVRYVERAVRMGVMPGDLVRCPDGTEFVMDDSGATVPGLLRRGDGYVTGTG